MRPLCTRKTLLVDDDKGVRESLDLFFSLQGYSLTSFDSAEEAMNALRNEYFDVIICDYWLPDMDGLMFFNLIRRLQPEAVKILITAYINDDVAYAAMEVGVHDFVRKPFRAEEIEDAVSALLNYTDCPASSPTNRYETPAA